MKKNTTSIIVLVILVGVAAYFMFAKNKDVPPVNDPSNTPVVVPSDKVSYDNTEYGFTFTLIDSWKGYTVVTSAWQGSASNVTKPSETGPKLFIRNPRWAEAEHYEDIPILIFTLAQWNSYMADNFSVSAAPFPASELGRNNKYVFALPPRWDYDYSKGYEEAQTIVKSKPLAPYSI